MKIDVSRGDVLAAAASPPAVADQFQATIIWMHDEPMLPGRPYLIKLGTRTVTGSITAPKYKVNVNTLEHLAAKQLELNEIGVCNLSLDRPIAFDPYTENRDTGGFILIDKISNDTVGAGLAELRAATLGEYSLAGAGREQARPRGAEGPARLRAVVHRACPALVSPPSRTWWRSACMRSAATPTY